MAGCYYCFFLADLLRSFTVLEQFFTDSAGPVLDVSGFCACRVLRFCLLKAMDRSFFLVALVIAAGSGL